MSQWRITAYFEDDWSSTIVDGLDELHLYLTRETFCKRHGCPTPTRVIIEIVGKNQALSETEGRNRPRIHFKKGKRRIWLKWLRTQ